MSSARIRIALDANGTLGRVTLGDPGGPTVWGTFPLTDLDAGSPTRAEILEAVRENLTADQVFVRAGEKLFKAVKDAGIAGPWRQALGPNDRTFLEIDDSNAK